MSPRTSPGTSPGEKIAELFTGGPAMERRPPESGTVRERTPTPTWSAGGAVRRERRLEPCQGHGGHRHRPDDSVELGDRGRRALLQGRDHCQEVGPSLLFTTAEVERSERHNVPVELSFLNSGPARSWRALGSPKRPEGRRRDRFHRLTAVPYRVHTRTGPEWPVRHPSHGTGALARVEPR